MIKEKTSDEIEIPKKINETKLEIDYVETMGAKASPLAVREHMVQGYG